MKKILMMAIAASAFALTMTAAQDVLPKDVLTQLESYDVSWNTLSTTGSLECMPLGNGDVTVNVWVEKDGDLMLYIGKPDAWAESTRLLKVGRVRVSLSPNPFEGTSRYSQILRLADGTLDIDAKSGEVSCSIKVWVDAYSPKIHVDVRSDKKISLTCTNEIMRKAPYVLESGADPLQDSFRGVVGSPIRPCESADIVLTDAERIAWAHRNETSLYPVILERQGAAEFIGKYEDPYMSRTFGAAAGGKGMRPVNDTTLASVAPARIFNLEITALTAQTPTLEQYVGQLAALASEPSAKDAYKAHVAWWRAFWNRSWVFLSGDADAEKLTRGWLLQRYMMACQSRGAYPVKFNGGTLTFDYLGNNADYRRWGPGYWHQNCRLYYWPLLASGDFDLIKPWFDMYMDMMPLQMDVTRKMYGHGGAFFPETLNFFGMFIQDDWGWNNADGKASQTRWIRYHYSGALEMTAMMLDYYAYTKDEDFAKEYLVPFAEQTVRFFARHWQRIEKKLNFVPANSLEQFWDCLNPIDYIAGLKYTLSELEKLPEGLVCEALRAEWKDCADALPAMPMRDGRILPAEEYGVGRNFENPELYTIFPFRLYGLGLPDIETARRTYDARVFDSPTCWAQDAIQAALLGNAEDAKKYALLKANAVDPEIRFPAFWRPGSDYTPDLDSGGVMAMAVQYMLLNCIDGRMMLLPALPDGWSADFKLHAHDGQTVRVKSSGKEILEKVIKK